MWEIESNIRAHVLLDLSNLLRKSDKMLEKSRIFSLNLNLSNKTWVFLLASK